MVSILSLWLPILLSAVFVFLISFVLHTVLTYHFKDFRKIPNEDAVMDELRKHNIPDGEYALPYAMNQKELNTPEFKEKVNKGPAAFLTIWKGGQPSMATSLTQWFVYCLIVGVFAAYVAGRALGPGAEYLAVFRFAGTTAFLGYTLALWQDSIWYKKSWAATLRNTFDGLVYGLLTAGTFGWLWPD
ncbi:MAG: hypothetical protein HYW57_03070 [Ignavibacteriales bacterium]|nr:hypothetical protein [Ignavibacteriales bacterium]